MQIAMIIESSVYELNIVLAGGTYKVVSVTPNCVATANATMAKTGSWLVILEKI